MFRGNSSMLPGRKGPTPTRGGSAIGGAYDFEVLGFEPSVVSSADSDSPDPGCPTRGSRPRVITAPNPDSLIM